MVARLVTFERDLRRGPLARSGVRSIVRGRRPEFPPGLPRLGVSGTMRPARRGGNESMVDGVRAPPGDEGTR